MISRQVVMNIGSNYFYVIYMGILSLILLPWYLEILGTGQWGIVAVCISFQGILMILELGLSQFMPKEFAEAKKKNNIKTVLNESLKIYSFLGLSLFIFAHIFLLLSDRLFSKGAFQNPEVIFILRIFLFQFLFNFINNVFISFYMGIERQVTANTRLLIFSSSRHLLALMLLTFMEPIAFFYVIGFVTASFVELLANSFSVFRLLRRDKIATSIRRQQIFKSLLKRTGGFSLAVIVGMICSQMDRLYLIQASSVDDFGTYVIVMTLALYLMHLQAPIQKAILPVLIRAQNETDRIRLLHQHLRLVFIICVIPCCLFALNTEFILNLWLNREEITMQGQFLLSLASISVAISSIYSVFYNVLIEKNEYHTILLINISAIFLQVIVIIFGPKGIIIGGYLWITIAFCQLLASVIVYSRILTKDNQ